MTRRRFTEPEIIYLRRNQELLEEAKALNLKIEREGKKLTVEAEVVKGETTEPLEINIEYKGTK